MAEILDGLKVSKEIKQEIKAEVEKILAKKKSSTLGSYSCWKQRSK
jgi:hypothetical protein